MKKVIFGLTIAAMAVGVSAFTATKSSRVKSDALVDYIWYPVSGTETDCDQAGPDLTLYPVSLYAVAEDIPASAEPTPGCSGQLFCCAKGYSTSNVEMQEIGGEDYWVPKTSAADAERKRNQ